MRRRSYAAIALSAAAAVSALSAAADAPAQDSFVIYGDTSIGGFRPYERNGRLSQAIAVFGEPQLRLQRAGSLRACVARWPSLGLSMRFFPYARTCVPERSCFHEATITGLEWRTAKGLKIGDSRQRLYQLYPKLKPYPGGWRGLLVRAGLANTYAAVSAKLVARRVVALRVTALSCEGFFP